MILLNSWWIKAVNYFYKEFCLRCGQSSSGSRSGFNSALETVCLKNWTNSKSSIHTYFQNRFFYIFKVFFSPILYRPWHKSSVLSPNEAPLYQKYIIQIGNHLNFVSVLRLVGKLLISILFTSWLATFRLWQRGVVVITTAHLYQLGLNSVSAQVQTLLTACRRFAMVRISDSGPGFK